MDKPERTLSDSEILSILAILARGDRVELIPGPDNTTKLVQVHRKTIKTK